jgi:uncharacterized protein involved in exopolysaccharide biosynthesis
MSDDKDDLILRAAARLHRPGLLRSATDKGDNLRSGARGGRPNHPPMQIDRWAIFSRKYVLIGSTVLIAAALAAAMLSLAPRYTAVAIIAVADRAPNSASDGDSGVDGKMVGRSPDAAVVYREVNYLRSLAVARTAIDNLLLWNLTERNAAAQLIGPLGAITGWISSAVAWFRRVDAGHSEASSPHVADQAALLDKFRSKLVVEAQPNSRIIAVRFEDLDPNLAVAAANAVANQSVTREIGATPNAARELSEAEAARHHLEMRLTSLRSAAGTDPINAATSELAEAPAMRTLQEQAAGLQSILVELSAKVRDSDPQIQQVKAAIDQVHYEMRAELVGRVAALEAELKAAAAKEVSLRRSLAKSRTGSADSSPGEVKLSAPEANTRLPPRANVQIIASAGIPVTRTFPGPNLLLAATAMASMMAGLGLAVIAAEVTVRFRGSEQTAG